MSQSRRSSGRKRRSRHRLEEIPINHNFTRAGRVQSAVAPEQSDGTGVQERSEVEAEEECDLEAGPVQSAIAPEQRDATGVRASSEVEAAEECISPCDFAENLEERYHIEGGALHCNDFLGNADGLDGNRSDRDCCNEDMDAYVHSSLAPGNRMH